MGLARSPYQQRECHLGSASVASFPHRILGNAHFATPRRHPEAFEPLGGYGRGGLNSEAGWTAVLEGSVPTWLLSGLNFRYARSKSF